MIEHWRNFPFPVTREAAVGYALYYGLFGPGPMSWGFVVGGGAVLLGIVAAVEFRIGRRRERTRDGQPLDSPPAKSLS